MTFDLAFHPDPRKEWEKLDATTREQFKKKLKERLQESRVCPWLINTLAEAGQGTQLASYPARCEERR
jgi:mRNA interferase RelE/StbE